MGHHISAFSFPPVALSAGLAQDRTSPPTSDPKLWPSGPVPLEITAQRAKAIQARQHMKKGWLTKRQKRQLVLKHTNPQIRAKARQAERSLQKRAPILSPISYSVTFTPDMSRVTSPDASLNFFGVSVLGSTFWLQYHSDATLGTSLTSPLVTLQVDLPSTGWYLIDFYGTGQPTATLHTWDNGYIPVESWDMTSSLTGYNHFVTAEYLEEGLHYFQFTVDTAYLYFNEVTIEAF